MKIKHITAYLCLLLVTFITCTAYAQSDKKEFQTDVLSYYDFINLCDGGDYIYAQDNARKLHILNQNFEEVVAPVYSYDFDFFDENGLMRVSNGYGQGTKHGFINTNGEEVIGLIYDSAYPFVDGVALVKKDGLWGGIDIHGNTVIDFQYDTAKEFKNGRYLVTKDGEYILIDQSGNDISNGIYDKYTSTNLSKNGYAFVTTDTLQYKSFTDYDTKEINYTSLFISNSIPKRWKDFEDVILPNFSIIDPYGNVVIDNLEPHIYTLKSAGPFTGPTYSFNFVPTRYSDYGIAFAKRNGKFGIIDTSGNILYDFKLDSYSMSGENYIGKAGDQRILFDKYGKAYALDINEYSDKYIHSCNNSDLIVLNKDDTFGIANIDGEIILPFEYDDATAYDEKVLLQKDGKFLTFNMYSEELREFKLSDGQSYSDVHGMGNEYFLVFCGENGLWGVADFDGNVIVEPLADKSHHIEYSRDNYITINNEDKTMYYNLDGDLLYYTNNYLKQDNLSTYNNNGKEIYPFSIEIYRQMKNLSSDNFYEAWIGTRERRSIVTINEVPQPADNFEKYICIKSSTPLININGVTGTLESRNYFVKPISDRGNLMCPIDPLFIALGIEIDWNDETKTASVTYDSNTVSMPLCSKVIYINGNEKPLNCEIKMINNRMYIPAQEVLNGLGINFEFNAETETLTVSK